ncbi:response regulator [Dactylosporangium sp. AC04546]|uniref:response regulator n=1 Tax=Dactylosporangium sp. AC04546 TaxID=2862460 RepID=UPI001EDDE62C|nr:response regulator [Dactylosporangium sp. AC04546]WVK78991.1 response regulator [Dactylosporangium sp. AC04546]
MLPLARILLVEDDPGDVAYALDEFAAHELRNPVTVLGDGAAALEYLARGPVPDILLLDLNLPGVDGRVVLDHVVVDPALARLVVVVLTGVDVEERTLRDFGVPSAYHFRKPVDVAQLAGLIRSVEQFSIGAGGA